jgi:hypothetical protein
MTILFRYNATKVVCQDASSQWKSSVLGSTRNTKGFYLNPKRVLLGTKKGSPMGTKTLLEEFFSKNVQT